MKKIKGYWVDDNNNKWRDSIPEQEAIRKSKSLIDCYDCVNCERGRNCKNCENCLGIYHCTNCKRCKDCIDCKNCYDCKECKNSLKLSKCDYCKHCDNCSNCSCCEECRICYDCERCTNCRDITGCYMLDKVSYQPIILITKAGEDYDKHIHKAYIVNDGRIYVHGPRFFGTFESFILEVQRDLIDYGDDEEPDEFDGFSGCKNFIEQVEKLIS